MKKVLEQFEEYVAGVLLLAMTALIVLQLILSYAKPGWASFWTTIVLGLFVWATMMGIPAATRRGAHLSLVLLRRFVSERWRHVLSVAVLVATVAFFAALAVAGLILCLRQAQYHNRFQSSSCPDWVVSSAIPVAAVLSCVRAVEVWVLHRRQAAPRGEE